MKEKIIAFLKKNIKYVLIVGSVLLFILWFNFKQGQIKRLTEKINTLEMANFGLNQDRETLEIKLKILQNDYEVIEGRNDSLKIVLKKYQLELVNLKKQHEKEIAELTNIPPDSIYKHLTAIYPNFDGTDTRFPFASSQIKPIYATFISYGMVQQEYSVLDKSFKSCLTLNNGFELGISNLNKQVLSLQTNIDKCDLQVTNYQKEVKILNKQISKKAFWNKTLVGGVAIAVLVAVIK